MTNRTAALEVFKSCTVEKLLRALLAAPRTARVSAIFQDPWTRNTIMVFEDESFAEVPDGESIPVRYR